MNRTTLRTRVRRTLAALATALTLSGALVALDPASPPAAAKGDGLAQTPPMGWSSWSAIRKNPTYATITAQADAIIANGLDKVGFTYVNVDDFYYACKGWGPAVDAYGRWVTDQTKFPDRDGVDGLKLLGDYLHGKGLKFGLYMTPGISMKAVMANTPIEGTNLHARDIAILKPGTDPSTLKTDSDYYNAYERRTNYGPCQSMAAIDFSKPGAQEFIDSWAREFASFGADYLKLDGVGDDPSSTLGTPDDVRAWSLALDKLSRPIHLELSNALPVSDISTWQQYSHGWRTQHDLENASASSPTYPYPLTSFGSVATRFDSVASWQPYAGTGGWNDYDSIEIGSPADTGLSVEEQRAQLTLWAMGASPLFLGTDLTRQSAADLALLKNKDVIAVDQDGVAAARMVKITGTQIFVKRELSGAFVLALFNTGSNTADIAVSLTDAGLSGTASLTDLWQGTSLGSASASYTAPAVPAHGVRLIRAVPAPTAEVATAITGNASGSCLTAATTLNAADAVLGACDGRGQQRWTATDAGDLRVGAAITQCLDVLGAQTAAGSKVGLYRCNGGSNQHWTLRSDGSIVGVRSGRCLTDTGVPGAALQIADCADDAHQRWSGFVRATAEAEAAGNTLAGGAVRTTCAACSGGSRVGYVGNGGTLTFTGVAVPAAGSRKVRIWYTNGGSARTATLSVNGGAAVSVSFPGTGGWSTPTSVLVSLNLASGSNDVKVANPNGWAPDIDRIDIVG